MIMSRQSPFIPAKKREGDEGVALMPDRFPSSS